MRAVKTSPKMENVSERIVSIDVLRGFALLGILLMNIQSFAMINTAYLNPTSYGDLQGINRWVWEFSHLFADQKFMSIFSLLFGASVFIITSRAEARQGHSAALHYCRNFWLFVIGMLHAYLLWSGDILVSYSICAIFIYGFRNYTPKKQLLLGLLFLSVVSLFDLIYGALYIPYWSPEDYETWMAFWKPDSEHIASELTTVRGSWLEQMQVRVPATFHFQLYFIPLWSVWRAGGLMIIGMALFKWGILSARHSKAFYAALMILGLGIGIPVVGYGIVQHFAAGWQIEYSMFQGGQFNYWGSLGIAIGYIGMIMLWCKFDIGERLKQRLAAVGRTALSNYILHTLICTTLFYGHGLGLYGKVERIGQLLIVLAIWTFQLWITPIWLHYFRLGPLEWLWRSLTYLKFQKMRLAEGSRIDTSST